MRSEPPSRPRAGPTIGGACLALGALGVLATGVRGDDKKAKVDERRRILKTLVEGFEATLAQRK